MYSPFLKGYGELVDIKPSVLVIDDEEAICQFVCDGLSGEGYSCFIASDAEEAIDKLKKRDFDVALLDIRLPGLSGIDLLRRFRKDHRDMQVVIMTAVREFDTAVEVMKLGAVDYIVKPFTIDQLCASIEQAVANNRLRCAVCCAIRGGVNDGDPFSEINAIACGVDAQVDCFDFHSKIVTEKTIEVAEFLGLQKTLIQKWIVERIKCYSRRDENIKSALCKLEQSPAAQMVLGLTQPIANLEDSNEKN